ncbi:hypothetical protein BDV97DRAFT_166799 [Delphinella strobiligena]|nr:hypothetical protein BDV97DRAFT_166799 [Delphinella strobiligena]
MKGPPILFRSTRSASPLANYTSIPGPDCKKAIEPCSKRSRKKLRPSYPHPNAMLKERSKSAKSTITRLSACTDPSSNKEWTAIFMHARPHVSLFFPLPLTFFVRFASRIYPPLGCCISSIAWVASRSLSEGFLLRTLLYFCDLAHFSNT